MLANGILNLIADKIALKNHHSGILIIFKFIPTSYK